jgi:DNA-binding transcriptional ArsR family regulator
MTTLHWTSGTACDFFLSLFVLHHAGEFGVRPAWAAGVRQRLSPPSRETLEQVFSFSRVPLDWISTLPEPRDAATALQAVASLPPASRLSMLTLPIDPPPGVIRLLEAVATRRAWTGADRAELASLFGRALHLTSAAFEALLNAWASLEQTGERYLAALEEYYTAYFAEEELRIRPAIEHGLESAQALATQLPPAELVERLSRGVRLEAPEQIEALTLCPSWWVTPLAFLVRPAQGNTFIAFGVRPETLPGTEGAEAPESLVSALKALGDPTRLRILGYLADGPLSPSELARRLRLRPPTVIHHLRLLRLAGLVQVTVGASLEKRYAARLEALQTIHISLQDYLKPHV